MVAFQKHTHACTHKHKSNEYKKTLKAWKYLIIPVLAYSRKLLEREKFNHSDQEAMRFMVDLAEERTGMIILCIEPSPTLPL